MVQQCIPGSDTRSSALKASSLRLDYLDCFNLVSLATNIVVTVQLLSFDLNRPTILLYLTVT